MKKAVERFEEEFNKIAEALGKDVAMSMVTLALESRIENGELTAEEAIYLQDKYSDDKSYKTALRFMRMGAR